MSAKHTPGPWHACQDGVCSCKTVTSSEFPVCKVTSGDWGDDYPSVRIVGESSLDRKAEAYMEQITYGSINPEVAAANARLIAAAPDLLEALTETLSWIKNWDPPFVDDDEWPETQAKIDAAIAKAGAAS